MATAVAASYELDPILAPFIHASDEIRARAYLERLINLHANPLIAKEMHRHVIRSSAETIQDEADLRDEMACRILQRIAAIRYGSARPISDLVAFIKIAVHHFFRRHIQKSIREENFSSLTLDLELSEIDGNNISLLIEKRAMLQSLWGEIRALPKKQRVALLCNFRDKNGANALPLLELCSIATTSEVSSALNIPASNLEEFFDQLPMEDSQIAPLLGVTTREVSDARQDARRKLQRRVRTWTA